MDDYGYRFRKGIGINGAHRSDNPEYLKSVDRSLLSPGQVVLQECDLCERGCDRCDPYGILRAMDEED